MEMYLGDNLLRAEDALANGLVNSMVQSQEEATHIILHWLSMPLECRFIVTGWLPCVPVTRSCLAKRLSNCLTLLKPL